MFRSRTSRETRCCCRMATAPLCSTARRDASDAQPRADRLPPRLPEPARLVPRPPADKLVGRRARPGDAARLADDPRPHPPPRRAPLPPVRSTRDRGASHRARCRGRRAAVVTLRAVPSRHHQRAGRSRPSADPLTGSATASAARARTAHPNSRLPRDPPRRRSPARRHPNSARAPLLAARPPLTTSHPNTLRRRAWLEESSTSNPNTKASAAACCHLNRALRAAVRAGMTSCRSACPRAIRN